jgi:hypothetical protein
MFLSESGKQREINVDCFSRLTPSLERKAPDEAKIPAL